MVFVVFLPRVPGTSSRTGDEVLSTSSRTGDEVLSTSSLFSFFYIFSSVDENFFRVECFCFVSFCQLADNIFIFIYYAIQEFSI